MTNKEAFMVYFPVSARAELILGIKLIDPTLADANAVSSAWGMIESATTADYSQGRTSESLSSSARKMLLTNAKRILKENGIEWNEGGKPTIGAVIW